MRQMWIHDAFTGIPIRQVYPSAARWTSRIKGSEDAQATFKLRDERMGKLEQSDIDNLFQENARMLMIRDDDAVEFYGPIFDTDDDPITGVLNVRARGIRNNMAGRLTFPVDNAAVGALNILNRSYLGAVRLILERMMWWSAQWKLPIDLPTDSSGGYSRYVNWWDALTADRLLAGIEAEGIEVWMRPYVAADRSGRFQPRVSRQITIGTVTDLFTAARKSPVVKLRRRITGQGQATGVIVFGAGSERRTLSAWSGYMDGPNIPVNDVLVTKKDIDNVGALKRIADAELAGRRFPTTQWTLEVNTERIPVSKLLPGSLLNLDVRKDRRKPDAQYALRVVALSGDWRSRTVKPEVQAYAS